AFFIKHRHKIRIYNTKKEAFFIMGIIFLIGIASDSLAAWRGYWSFEGPGLIGLKIGLLPIEEYTLFLITPFWGIVFYKSLHKNKEK
ncbi:MAG: hypothetical protein JSW40_03270, partial [Candidatus Omnitrophota bacterium]